MTMVTHWIHRQQEVTDKGCALGMPGLGGVTAYELRGLRRSLVERGEIIEEGASPQTGEEDASDRLSRPFI